ncbi:hypothetical protein DYBT9275_02189 [Dyadobacter sp. CECT 9275]|uniref:Uncharacterized protein n=1 Tax=Dyadobacter helix TaxID=2822344 RepID=A0A916JF67_9BACT|nr:four helix bundle protein [Dyadobacter sp. CECT 9275]CAG4999260.1 hypothetical protein DYBT9275_02189 [Dyadobacter sp. CECT 9275]
MNFEDEDQDWLDDDEADLRKDHKRIYQLPVMQKGREIFRIVHSLIDTLPEDHDLQFLREQMLTDAAMIPAKIAGAEGGNMYTLRMENAVMIKLSARALITHTYTCEMFSISDRRYLDLLRQAIDEFRELFVDWVKTFDKSNDLSDGWGQLFG